MSKLFRLVLPLGVLAMLALPVGALASHSTFPRTENITTLGESNRAGGFLTPPGVLSNPNSDIAFWRNYAIEGSYTGFRIIDISTPTSPTQVSEVTCGRDQGDITISPDGRVLVRSQDTARVIPGNNQANACDVGTTAPATTLGGTTQVGWEGLQIFDVSNKAAPRFLTGLFTDFGSHTHTQYHDRANNRLIIYVSRGGTREGLQGTGAYQASPPAPPSPYGGANWPADRGCITAVEVPLANPAAARVANRCIAAGLQGCHDVAVHEPLRRLYGACRPFMILWDITDPVNPRQLHAVTHPAVLERQGPLGGWHSASFSQNGEILLSGFEPGGGSDPECEAADPPTEKSIYFWRASDGALLGTWTLPRPQGPTENCTVHNYNVVPHPNRHIVVQGSYQSGWSFIDFTSPSAARELGWVDPVPLVPNQLGGDWSTHWYNGLVYQSDITRGVAIYDVTESWWDDAISLRYLNPQTQTELLSCTVRAVSHGLRANRSGHVMATVRVNGQRLAGIRVRLRGGGVDRTRRTNESGVVESMIRPIRGGTLRIQVPDHLNMEGCATSRRIAAAPRRAGQLGGGAGAALTGRPR
jgi:LVIVD repeat-containing protein